MGLSRANLRIAASWGPEARVSHECSGPQQSSPSSCGSKDKPSMPGRGGNQWGTYILRTQQPHSKLNRCVPLHYTEPLTPAIAKQVTTKEQPLFGVPNLAEAVLMKKGIGLILINPGANPCQTSSVCVAPLVEAATVAAEVAGFLGNRPKAKPTNTCSRGSKGRLLPLKCLLAVDVLSVENGRHAQHSCTAISMAL